MLARVFLHSCADSLTTCRCACVSCVCRALVRIFTSALSANTLDRAYALNVWPAPLLYYSFSAQQGSTVLDDSGNGYDWINAVDGYRVLWDTANPMCVPGPQVRGLDASVWSVTDPVAQTSAARLAPALALTSSVRSSSTSIAGSLPEQLQLRVNYSGPGSLLATGPSSARRASTDFDSAQSSYVSRLSSAGDVLTYIPASRGTTASFTLLSPADGLRWRLSLQPTVQAQCPAGSSDNGHIRLDGSGFVPIHSAAFISSKTPTYPNTPPPLTVNPLRTDRATCTQPSAGDSSGTCDQIPAGDYCAFQCNVGYSPTNGPMLCLPTGSFSHVHTCTTSQTFSTTPIVTDTTARRQGSSAYCEGAGVWVQSQGHTNTRERTRCTPPPAALLMVLCCCDVDVFRQWSGYRRSPFSDCVDDLRFDSGALDSGHVAVFDAAVHVGL